MAITFVLRRPWGKVFLFLPRKGARSDRSMEISKSRLGRDLEKSVFQGVLGFAAADPQLAGVASAVGARRDQLAGLVGALDFCPATQATR